MKLPMFKHLRLFVSPWTDPYLNLACEEELLRSARPEECGLYLWQNDRTVVIGRNQNAYRECHIYEMQADGVKLARRLSGGGAVYHDMGNLNYSFVCADDDYNRPALAAVVLGALAGLGVEASLSGRNDIEVSGRKFSGSAFYKTDGCVLHHGTLMCNVDCDKMNRYLHASSAKLKSRGVRSVKARVRNLCEIVPDITVAKVSAALQKSYADTFGIMPAVLSAEEMQTPSVEEKRARFASEEWLYGKEEKFSETLGFKGPAGEIYIEFATERGIIRTAHIFTDSLAVDLPERYAPSFEGVAYGSDRMKELLETLGMPEEEYERLV
ncbi:MAG: lipoate--protein ligase [Lachnospiraceae bacterium]|jgi:lipoate-protein ligase A|nr:lipoate--protein ligase [Lachnospiraceae bacterium]